MGLISFLKGAGEKVFGWDSEEEIDAKDQAAKEAEQQARNQKASAALKDLVKAHDLVIMDLEVGFDAGQVTVSGTTEKSATAEKAALVVGNVKGVSGVENNISITNPEPQAVYHTVVKGEYLSLIAKKYYGNALRYNEIFEANKPMLKDIDLIYPGQVLRIPGAQA